MLEGSRKLLFYSFTVIILISVFVAYSFQLGLSMNERHSYLIKTSSQIKLNTTTANLLFERAMRNEQTVPIEKVWSQFDQSEQYARSIRDENVNDIFNPLSNPNLSLQIEEVIKSLHQVKKIAQQRWSSKSTPEVDQTIDQQFTASFSHTILLIDKIEDTLQGVIANEIETFKSTQRLLISIIFIIGFPIIYLLLRSNNKRIKNTNELKISEKIFSDSQKQLLNIIKGAKLGYWDWNYKTGGNIVNEEWLLMLGLTRDETGVNDVNWEALVHPNDKKLIQETIQANLQSEESCITEFRMKHAEGHWVWIQSSGAIVEFDQLTNEAIRICGIHQDITNRKLAELRDKSRTNILELLTHGELLPVVLNAIVDSVEQESSDTLCSILLLDATGNNFVTGMSPNLPDFYSEAIIGTEVNTAFGSFGKAVATNQRVIFDKTHNNFYCQAYKELANKAEIEACCSEPIHSSQGNVIGVITIYHHDARQPTLVNLNLIEQATYLASIAIEQSQNNLALQNNEMRFHQLLQSIPSVSVQGYDYQGNTTYWNKASEDLYGYSADEAIGNSMFDLIIPSEMHSDVRGAMTNMMNSELPIPSGELTLKTKSGTSVDVYSNHAYVHVPGLSPEMFCLDVDLTERKHAEKKLKLAASVFTYAREGILITDETATIIDINQAFTDITGYSREEVIGKNPRIFQSGIQSPEFYIEMWQELIEKGRWSGEMWNKRKNGEIYAAIKTISAVRDENGVTTHYVSLGSDITPMKEHQSQLEHIAHYDLLTNLPNRTLLSDRLSQTMLHCHRNSQSLAVVFLDLDGFKAVNDAHGHEMGDELLIILSNRMKDALREGDSLARFGGDEFVAVLTDLTKVEECKPVLERLLLAASEPVSINNILVNISASIGVTMYPQDSVDADLLMRHADQAMYVAKESGKNRYHLFDTDQDDAVKTQRESIEAIQSALFNDQFVLHYQPKVNMRTGIITGTEALIRWQHPERGLLSPMEFLHVIENHSLMIELGEWVIDTALKQISIWQKMGFNLPINISVNIAAVQLQQPDFVQRLTTLLKAHPDVDPHNLELEILETSALDDVRHVSKIMNACKALGVNFALDDFGTGYSSLTYLRRLPANMIKIDQSFVRDMLYDADDFAIVKGVIALARSFKREVIAEGVESIEHGSALLQLGCELAQGYGIARPMPASEIPNWVLTWAPDINWKMTNLNETNYPR